MKLYRANIRLSQKIFSILGVFEIVLRNAIDTHYKTQFLATTGNTEWLLSQMNPGGYLTSRGCHKSLQTVQDAYNTLSRQTTYTHDKLVAELSFGFWRFQFASKEFRAAGSTLHLIFITRPRGTNHTDIFNKLGDINKLRNRIAHHEPICFGPGSMISTMYAHQHYNYINELITWLGYSPDEIFYGIDHVQIEIDKLNRI
jgi:hypothetical protein